VSRHRAGMLAGVGAYLLWGILPLYWPLLKPAGAIEIIAHRIAWSLFVVAGVLAATIGFRWLRTLDRRRALLLGLASVLITINWGTYIYAVNAHRVVETALGYFINPLVTVLLAVVVLREHLRPKQRIGIAIATLAVVVLAIDYGHPPWIALLLACSFGLYGLVKKQVGLDGTQSMAIETLYLIGPSVAYIAVIQADGSGTLTSEGLGHALLFVGAGVVTAVPLMLFGASAVRLPLATLGLLQYLAPTMQFLIGVLIRHEPMPLPRLAGFVLVWIALVVFTVDAVRTARRTPAADCTEPEELAPALVTRHRNPQGV
jgi:chloramphenicol-sensitive protein RarD